jgi:GDP-L-fucose synthase
MKILITGGNGNIAQMIRRNLNTKYDITNLSHKDLDILDFNHVKEYLEKNNFDILVHTAITGGRRTKDENCDVTHKNILMFENLIKFANKFKMIINFDSGAIYDRSTNILNRKEHELYTVPTDYYGLSKYIIYNRTLSYNNCFNLRIFNIFHINEEPDRFIKSCFIAKKNNSNIKIFEDKYFDFIYEDDFIKIIDYYFDNVYNQDKLNKTINLCYGKKYKLSDIAFLITNDKSKIIIEKDTSNNNYCGNSELLKSINIDLIDLQQSLLIYKNKFNKLYYNNE